MEKKLKFLDCTLRDGGYYNRWDFSEDLIKSYLKTMFLIGIDVVEIGFRGTSKNSYLGPLAYSSDDYLKQLKISNKTKISVMVNASEILSGNVRKNIGNLFSKKKNSPVTFVRLACHFKEIDKIGAVCNILGKLGYKVIVNLMQISERTNDEVKFAAKYLNDNKNVSCMYFADSLGSMSPADVQKVIKIIRQNFKREIGIHTHDNLGKALSNTIAATSSGVSWIDSTVYGMGRGPGNLKTEIAQIEIAKSQRYLNNIDSMMYLINKHFMPLYKKYLWGTNPFYYIAGKSKIHPTYIQTMLSDNSYNYSTVKEIVNNLKKIDSAKFNPKHLDFTVIKNIRKINWSPERVFKNKDVLILGNGKSSIDHKKSIELFIKKKRPIVLALNSKKNINEKYVDFRIASHPFRILTEISSLSKLRKKIILPYSQLPEHIKNKITKKKIFDFGIKVKKDVFEIHKNFCVVPNNLVFCYALGVINSGKVKNIYLAGFDGYDKNDARHIEMNNSINTYFNSKNKKSLLSITPTIFKIKSKSIYSYI